MPLTSITSQKGKKILVHDGILYVKKRVNKNDISWRCATNPRCNLLIHTDSDLRTGNIVGTVPVHDHPGDAVAVEAKVIKLKMLKRARKTDDKTSKEVTRSLHGILSPGAALLPKTESLSRAINRARAVDNPQIVNPASRGDLKRTEELKYTHGGELFLLHDSGGDKKRFLIFTTLRNLNYLATCDQWLGDGSFRSVPGIFMQLYSIHGFKNSRSLPLIYVVAPNKLQRLYEQVLTIIRDALPNYKPARMMIDFEEAFIISFKKKYSGVSLFGCFFHFSQCLWRHIQYCGLQKTYDTDIEFAFNLRLLSALAFVPLVDVIKCYDLIVATDFYELHEEELDDLLKYFEATWIGKPCHNKKKRDKPRYDLSLWNCHVAVINDYLRTNNPTDGWHNRSIRGVGVSHATVSVFINALKDEQVHTELCMTQIDTGNNVGNRRREYRDYEERLKRVVSNYNASLMLNFVKNVAKIISFNM